MLLRPRQILAPIVFATVFGYFGYHLVNGDRGLLALAHLQRETMIANQNLAAAAVLGRIVNVGRLGGMKGEFDFDLHALKRIDYIGVTFRTRTLDDVREINRLMRADLWPALEAGKLAMPIDRTFPLEKAADALAVMRANAHFGKIVLTME